MSKILACAIIIFVLFSFSQVIAQESTEKEKVKDIYALSYLCGYKSYNAMAGNVMLNDRRFFTKGYKKGFAEALIINLNESAFEQGFNDAKDRRLSKYPEDMLKE